jgi:glycosyltransferase involved in cell wall biosynthesis
MYNCVGQIPKVLEKLNHSASRHFAEILVVDNGSTDGSIDACAAAFETNARKMIRTLVRNDANYNLGGSHKVAFDYALDQGYDYVAVLHGDDQGDIEDLLVQLKAGAHRDVDCLLGARFMSGSRLANYSAIRTLGNLAFNVLFSLVCWRRLYDLGAGLNLYKTEYLRPRAYLRFPNSLTFNYYFLLYTVTIGGKFRYFPIGWSESGQVSNLKLLRHVSEMLRILWRYTVERRRFLDTWLAPQQSYGFRLVKQLRPNWEE